MIRLAMAALTLGLMQTGASAFDLTEERFDARIGGRAVPVTARLAEEGLGYSVLQGVRDRRGALPRARDLPRGPPRPLRPAPPRSTPRPARPPASPAGREPFRSSHPLTSS
jgi:hypothetical protein